MKNNKLIIGIIVVLLVVILGLGGYIIFTGNKGENGVASDKEVRVDASLATQPLMDAYVERLSSVKLNKEYTNTDPAYTKLINNETDLIIVTEPSEDELNRAKDGGVELEVTPVVNEGFVFFTNKNSKVNNLTIEQIQKIYTGEYTNWKEVGGPDAEIIAYQRPANSGSQTGILSLVMKGLKMKEPTTEEFVSSMAGIIDVVANYDNAENSIGYSYYYYATTMYGNDNIKFFNINGIAPNHDTIKDESYPLITHYYIVTRKGDDRSEVKAAKNAMLSREGQAIAKDAGYVEIN